MGVGKSLLNFRMKWVESGEGLLRQNHENLADSLAAVGKVRESKGVDPLSGLTTHIIKTKKTKSAY